jgi:hypothetical protein
VYIVFASAGCITYCYAMKGKPARKNAVYGRHHQTTTPRRSISVVSILILVACCLATGGVYFFTLHQTRTTPMESVQGAVVETNLSIKRNSAIVDATTVLDGPVIVREKKHHQQAKQQPPNQRQSHQETQSQIHEQAQQQIHQPMAHTRFNEEKMLQIISILKDRVRKLRSSKKVLMPVDPGAVTLTTTLQNATRCYLMHTLPAYFPTPLSAAAIASSNFLPPLNLAIKLKFPAHMTAIDQWLHSATNGSGIITLYVELAPALLLPHAVFTIVQIAQTFKSGQFHRNAGHVLQSQIQAKFTGGVVFMEYHRAFPHEKYTLGFAGRGGGNAFYISTQNNTSVHGPGTDRGGKDPESDTDFGLIIPGYNGEDIVKSMTKQTGSKSKNGFIEGNKNFIGIQSLRLLSTEKMREEIGQPKNIRRTKYSARQEYLRGLQAAAKYATAEDYCLPFL